MSKQRPLRWLNPRSDGNQPEDNTTDQQPSTAPAPLSRCGLTGNTCPSTGREDCPSC